ncbi:MAG TPA: HAMP domain-containing sensor histidine kinase [Blastocatellia bacterium]|nr:HAMP domain-containing sensor histidine kinase [Blastocatellia bacterium]
MERLKTFLKKRALLMGTLAVAIPLVFIIYWQYRSLKSLEKTLPIYRKEVMRDYLRAVVKDVHTFYYDNALEALSVSPEAITNRVGGEVQARDDAALTAALRPVAEHFAQKNIPGAGRFFIVVDTVRNGVNQGAVLFYNPATRRMQVEPNAPELQAINVACAAYLIYIRGGTHVLSVPQGIDRNPWFPLVVKPVVEASEKIVAVSGMVIDQQYFLKELLPAAIDRPLRDTFPTDYQDVIVAVNDEEGMPVYGDEPIKVEEEETYMRFSFIFTRWFLTTRMRGMSEAQWARRYFLMNLSLGAAMTLFLIGGIALTLRTAARAMKLSQMKSDFVSNVSHELRTPLASIRVFGEFLKLGRVKDATKMREYGEYIETESRRLTQLINNILDFSRIESGQKRYHFYPTDLCELVADTLKVFEVRLKQDEFKIHFTAQAGLPRVAIDSDAMIQALVNLLDNAVKYSGASRDITIKLDRQDEWVTLAVSDRGVGIPEEDQEKVFERFHRVSTGLVHDVKGSGLGLAIVKHIVEAHGGKVTLDSRPGRGSTFTIFLPALADAGAERDASAPGVPAGGQSLARG